MGRTSVPQSIDLIGMICDLYVREFYHRKIVDHIFLGKLLMTMKLRTPVYHGDSLNPVYYSFDSLHEDQTQTFVCC